MLVQKTNPLVLPVITIATKEVVTTNTIDTTDIIIITAQVQAVQVVQKIQTIQKIQIATVRRIIPTPILRPSLVSTNTIDVLTSPVNHTMIIRTTIIHTKVPTNTPDITNEILIILLVPVSVSVVAPV